MPAIIKIGYTKYLVKSELSALAAIATLSEAIEVDETWERKTNKHVFWPRGDKRHREIGLEIIHADQLRAKKPLDRDA